MALIAACHRLSTGIRLRSNCPMRKLLIALFGLAGALAQDSGSEKKFGVIEGQVVNSQTGQALRRANLTLRPANPGGIGSGGFASPGAPYATSTDAEGKFRFEKVEPGSYRLAGDRQGYVRQEYGGKLNAGMGATLTVAAGQEIKELLLKMTPQGVLIGKVLDDEGEPLARVLVQVLRRRYLRGKVQFMPMQGAASLDNGDFRIADLAPGRYWLSASYRPIPSFEGPARTITDKPEEEYVRTYYPGSLDESAARPVDLVAGQELSGLNIQLRKARVYRVRGKVAGATNPRGFRTMLLPRDRTAVGVMLGAGSPVREDGSFEIASVQPGSYNVALFAAQGMLSPMGRTPVDVSQGNVDDVRITVQPGIALNGLIRFDSEEEQQKLEKSLGKPITFAGARVQLTVVDTFMFNSPSANVKDDGAFVLENASPEKYRIWVMGLPPGTWQKSVRIGEQDPTDGLLDLTAGAPGTLEVRLGTGIGRVSGTVQDTDQKPVQGAVVSLVPEPLREERTDLLRVATSDQSGQFNLQNLPPGEYRIYAWEEIEPGAYLDPEFLKPFEDKSVKVTVKTNGAEQVTLVQIPASATTMK